MNVNVKDWDEWQRLCNGTRTPWKWRTRLINYNTFCRIPFHSSEQPHQDIETNINDLRENIGLDFVNFGSKTYIELFTYLCRQIIKLALYTHLNSAKKKYFVTKVSFVACPIVLKWSFWWNEWQSIHVFSQYIDKSGIMAESRTKGKEY